MVEDVTEYFDPPNKQNITTCLNCSKTFQFDWDVMINHMHDAHGIKTSAEGMKSYLQTCIDERKEMTPKSGYDVMELDDFARPGEKLSRIAHFETRAEAEKFVEKNNSNESTLYVYGSDDN